MDKGRVEIARSFSFKLNIGNYQSVDFFCSEKTEVDEFEAERASEALYTFCKEQVMKDVSSYRRLAELATAKGIDDFGEGSAH